MCIIGYIHLFILRFVPPASRGRQSSLLLSLKPAVSEQKVSQTAEKWRLGEKNTNSFSPLFQVLILLQLHEIKCRRVRSSSFPPCWRSSCWRRWLKSVRDSKWNVMKKRRSVSFIDLLAYRLLLITDSLQHPNTKRSKQKLPKKKKIVILFWCHYVGEKYLINISYQQISSSVFKMQL